MTFTTLNRSQWIGLLATALTVLAAGLPVSAQHLTLTERNFLTSRYDSAAVTDALVTRAEWKPYPKIDDRSAWDALPEAVRSGHIAEAESLLGTSWPELPATVFLEYVKTGNRSNFQRLHFLRREQLAKLVLGEVFEDEGRFLDDIVNGIWAISEETFWGIPAHLDLQSAGFGLPDVNEPAVDLFAAETASLMAWTLYLLGDRLDMVSPLVRPRIEYELKRRLLDPNLEREDFWWMAFNPSVINNWNPWINSNWLAAVLIAEDDPARRGAAVWKIMQSVDIFINSYPDDGGCDEGPGYWSRAPGSLFEVLDFLYESTGGLIDIFDEPLIAEMGRFMLKGHVGGDYFINFADARPVADVDAAVVFRYGERLGDEDLARFGAYFARRQALGSGYVPGRFGHLGRQLLTLFALDAMDMTESSAPLTRDAWLADLQVMTARTVEGSTAGLYLAAKGGHNGENHNHNDVGSFIVYSDGEPVIVDLGPATYTRQTFSDDRYSIWNLQSAYHNVPTVNGRMQPFGAQFRAENVEYQVSDGRARLSMDLASAYPDEADIESWAREVELDRSDRSDPEIKLVDRFELADVSGESTLNFITNWDVDVESSGVVRLERLSNPDLRPVELRFDPDKIGLIVEVIEIEDQGLARSWGDQVSRVSLVLSENALPSGRIEVRIAQVGSSDQ